MFSRLRQSLGSSWRAKARPEQLAPNGDWWNVWYYQGGRGTGKTRAGSEYVLEQIASGACRRMGLIAPTAADVRDVMVEGPSGILNVAPNHLRPNYEPSKRRLTFDNGAICSLYSADEPQRLRGPEHDGLWADEIAAWRYIEAWDLAMMGLRIGRARVMATSTPKPVRLIRDLLAREGKDVAVTRGKTSDNAANLSPQALEALQAKYGGTRLGRQELDGELLEDVPGALWQRAWIDRDRVTAAPDLRRVIVAIDPAVSNNEGSDATGIVVAGISRDDHCYILADATGRYDPAGWARKAVALYKQFGADRIVAEVNNGGDLVENTLRTVDASIPFKKVHASRGKVIRAEPVSALYEQQKVHHVGTFSALEDQMCAFTSDFNRSTAGYSPDALDACVWAITELAVKTYISPVACIGHYSVQGGGPGNPKYQYVPPHLRVPDYIERGLLYPVGDFRWKLEAGKKWLAKRGLTSPPGEETKQ